MRGLFFDGALERKKAAFHLRAVCVVFVLFFGGGLIAAAVYPDTALEIIVALGQSFADKGLFTAAPLAQVWLIFLNNLTVCVLLLVLGLVPFLFLPYVVVALNALTAGVVVQALPLPDGSGRFWAAAVSLLPHGVFELPALFIAAALGAFCCARLTGVILHRTRLPAADAPPTRPIRTALLLAKTFLLLVLPLLVVAAATEVWLTPLAQKALL